MQLGSHRPKQENTHAKHAIYTALLGLHCMYTNSSDPEKILVSVNAGNGFTVLLGAGGVYSVYIRIGLYEFALAPKEAVTRMMAVKSARFYTRAGRGTVTWMMAVEPSRRR